MPAIRLTAFRTMVHRLAICCGVILALAVSLPISAQNIPGIDPNIEATLIADGPAIPGQDVVLAIHFEPVSDEWHGYWENPGDAGLGMQLEWDLPKGWTAGEPQYPIPQKLLIGDLMNHIYEGPYAVLIPITVPADAEIGGAATIRLKAQWLACTDQICVPEEGEMQIALPVGKADFGDSRFAGWKAAIPPVLDSVGGFQVVGETLRLSIPVPSALQLADTHIFLANLQLGVGLKPAYAARQSLMRDGDILIAEIPLLQSVLPEGVDFTFEPEPKSVSGILTLGNGSGVQFRTELSDVPAVRGGAGAGDFAEGSLALLLLAALAGGLLLNVMPCVFPILSLKALSLAKAGESAGHARRDGLAYTAGVVIACVALGATMLALRAAGEQVGWAFQLQEPAVVVALLVLATLITANFAGAFELPSFSITRSGEPASAFASGLLAAVAATPCTGPFMAAAVGAALLLPTEQALLLFAVLGLGLALPFLLIGFIPALRRMLPKPGPWMTRFRKVLAIPMGLTALALIWLLWRMGGNIFALNAVTLALSLMIVVTLMLREHVRRDKYHRFTFWTFAVVALLNTYQLYVNYDPIASAAHDSILVSEPFSGETLSDARENEAPVFAYFTADWCVTCKLNEKVAIEREATRDAFEKAGVIVLRGDWTQRDPAISQFLTEQGVAGIPLYVWYAPGEEGQILPQILTPDSLVTLAQNLPQSTGGTPQ